MASAGERLMSSRSSEPSSRVRLEQAVEAEQGREQGRDPQDGGADARQQVQVRPDAERHQRYQDEEEHHAERGAAADAPPDPEIAAKEGGQR